MGRWRSREGALPELDLANPNADAEPDELAPYPFERLMLWVGLSTLAWLAVGVLVAWLGGRLS